MMRNIIVGCIATVILSYLLLTGVSAAKQRIWKTQGAQTAGTSYSKAKLSRSTNSVVLTLQNLGSVTSVAYELSYTADGIPQGAMGAIAVSGQSTDTRDLYFGTCSHGVCTPHVNIQNATVLVTTTLSSGGKNVKRYRIKF